MHLGLHIIRFDWPGSPDNVGTRLAEIARTADDAGVTYISVMDHYFQIGVAGPREDPMLEGYVAATHIAAHTGRARVGVLASHRRASPASGTLGREVVPVVADW